MQKIDDVSYRKYFCQRRANSKWSEKNKKLAANLEKRGLMTDRGRVKIEERRLTASGMRPKQPSSPKQTSNASQRCLSL